MDKTVPEALIEMKQHELFHLERELQNLAEDEGDVDLLMRIDDLKHDLWILEYMLQEMS
jgi:hypothetical protein